ncbi:DNA-binding protein [Longispora fulva]|uniref:Transcriptional regulator with XRE-family HTH domain n=1 Tax=Longispora fulva TaxID=619741 RepID=A0A8J7GG89_9ACTN|nr:helix-turn-helix transcriptional regulator [Longispora fulva]MBG6137321.1 transcriptional regulator with XRE-family HTH domain [Longispora fulva]GIG61324.1 DNA-binding protein [Longispora fulva]
MSVEQTAQRRRYLGEFIRSRRERTTPEMVGMPPGLRRRTPGLRREEMALLAGVGITWYTWLEQGRPINVSAQVLRSVARVLGMDPTERAHVFTLAELPDPDAVEEEAPKVSPAVRMMLDQFDPFPAVVVGPRWELLAGNRAHLGLFGDYMALPAEYRNSLWMVFTDPEWRTLLQDWSGRARLIVAKARADSAAQIGDPAWARLLGDLRAHSADFRELWERNEVAPMDATVKEYRHPQAGRLRCEASHLWLSEQRGLRMTVHLPLDEETRAGFEVLASIVPRVLPRPPATTPVARAS